MLKLMPCDGRLVRDPNTKEPLDEKGEMKPNTPYWQKKLRDGDVKLVETKQTKVAKK